MQLHGTLGTEQGFWSGWVQTNTMMREREIEIKERERESGRKEEGRKERERERASESLECILLLWVSRDTVNQTH